ncbi:MAG: class I SAM-dependent methyltransferase [Syntrophales bacterium LBB04]|nr:class I SAM-dependent methyltransferase [Syntrophales bacterium LBB04]
MTNRSRHYLMENLDEAVRLEVKTDPEGVKKQAAWCGLRPGSSVLDAGCGPGKVTSILYDLVRPGGEILGVDYSEDRIEYAREHYGNDPKVRFLVHDLRDPLRDAGAFDLIWVRFVLEYNRAESQDIVGNLTEVLKPGGHLCLLDLDYNCLTHYPLPARMQSILMRLMGKIEEKFNFDPYSGRKLYSYLYDQGYEGIQMDLLAHHLIYGRIKDEDMFNWIKKVEVVSQRAKELFRRYPGGRSGFFQDFKAFFQDRKRFTYTPLILCKGMKPTLPL